MTVKVPSYYKVSKRVTMYKFSKVSEKCVVIVRRSVKGDTTIVISMEYFAVSITV